MKHIIDFGRNFFFGGGGGGVMHLQCFTPTCYMMGVATRTHKRDDHYLICTNSHYGACLQYYP